MRIFSGIQPTGRKHLGNYLGAIRQYVADQGRGESIYSIVDLHTITIPYDPRELRRTVLDTTALLMAAGLDPERCLLLRQSDVMEHTELCWLLSAVTSYGELARMHQFKEKSHQQKGLVSAGLFTYPILQAADILAYNSSSLIAGLLRSSAHGRRSQAYVTVRRGGGFAEGVCVLHPDFRFCVEFTVPDDVDLEERRNLPLASDPLINPTMTAWRIALRADGRWMLQHVSSIRPEVHGDRWHLLVWVLVSGPSLDEARKVAERVHDVVSGVTPASFFGVTEEP